MARPQYKSPARVLAADANKCERGDAELGPPNLADEERVRSRSDLFREHALEPAESTYEERRAVRPLLGRDPVPHGDRRHAAREVLGQPFLTCGEQGERAGRQSELRQPHFPH